MGAVVCYGIVVLLRFICGCSWILPEFFKKSVDSGGEGLERIALRANFVSEICVRPCVCVRMLYARNC